MGFAQEMKDFISAAEAGQKMVGALSDEEYKKVKSKYTEEMTKTLAKKNNDEEGDAATLEATRALTENRRGATALTQERIAASRENRAQVKAQIALDAANRPKSMTQSIDGAPPPLTRQPAVEVPPTPQVVPAKPVGQREGALPMPAVNDDSQDTTPLSDIEKSMMAGKYNNGGTVQKFAGGGAVGADDEEPADEETTTPAPQAEAVPTDEGTSDTTDISSRSRGFSGQAGLDGVKAGLTYGAKALGLHTPGSAVGGASPGRQRAAQAWATGQHAAPPEDMDKIKKWIDPENKMGESEQNLAAIGAVYQFKMKHNDPEGAAKAAFQMLQYHRQASQRYAVIAAHAADSGDIDTAVHAANKSYANVPDDKDVKFAKTPDGKVSYTYTDSKTGKVMSQGIENPDKLASAAMGFAEKGFDESLMAAIQMRPAAREKPAVDPNTQPMKTPDKTAALKGVDAAYDEQNPDDEKTGKPKNTPIDKQDIKGAAFRISAHSANSRMTHGEAVDFSSRIADPTMTDEAYRPAAKKVDGGYQVRIGQKQAFVPEADFDTLMAKRIAKIKAAEPKKPGEEGAGESWLKSSSIGDTIGKYVSGKFKEGDERRARSSFTEPSIP